MIAKLLALALLCFTSGAAIAQGNNCDCQQIVGTCQASISVAPTGSRSGSYGADLMIQSTAPICSKVDYYVDNTPYFTILSQGNKGDDRVFGQKPITRRSISEIQCRICQRVDQQHRDNDLSIAERKSLSGRWHAEACPGAPGWWGGGGPPRDVTVTLSVQNGQVTGELADASPSYSFSAQLNGTALNSTADVSSTVGSRHKMSLSSDGNTLTDNWCNKDGGCSTCVMQRN